MYSETTNISRSRSEVYCPSPLLQLYSVMLGKFANKSIYVNLQDCANLTEVLLKIALMYLALGSKLKVPLVMVLGVVGRPYI